MTIKFYPSRLPGEPLETHEHGVLTLHDWLSRNVPSYSQDKTHPVVIMQRLSGQAVPGGMAVMFLQPDNDVRIYPIPWHEWQEGTAWVSVAILVRLRPMHYSLPLNQSWAAFHPVTLHRWI